MPKVKEEHSDVFVLLLIEEYVTFLFVGGGGGGTLSNSQVFVGIRICTRHVACETVRHKSEWNKLLFSFLPPFSIGVSS